MNPNQPPPHHQYPPGAGGAPSAQNPSQNPGYPPGGGFPSGPPFGGYPPIYQAGMPQQFGAMGPPANPGGGAGEGPAPFMMKQTSSVKPEPSWDGYEPSGSSAGPPVGPAQGPQPQGGYAGTGGFMPPNLGTMRMPIVLGNDPRHDDSSMQHYPTSSASGSGSGGGSLLAQHLQSTPQAPQQQPPQSHLSQLLQQPVYQGGLAGPGGGAQGAAAAAHQRPGMPQYDAMRMSQMQMHQQYQMHQHFMAEQQAQMQQSRAAQLQAEQAAQAAAQQAQMAHQHQQQGGQSQQQQSAMAAAVAAAYRNAPISYANPDELLLPNQTVMPVSMCRISPHHDDADLHKLPTGELCQYGRELVSDLNLKTSSMALYLKKVMEKRPLVSGENPTEVATRCRMNLNTLSQIRVIIEKRRDPTWKRLTGDDYIELMLDDSELEKPMDEKRKDKRAELEMRFPRILATIPPNEGDVYYKGRWMPEALHKKYMKFEANKAQLVKLASDLKALQWKIDVTSPQHLKRVDQTKISKKRPDMEP